MSEKRTIYFAAVYAAGVVKVTEYEATITAKQARIESGGYSTGYRRQWPIDEVHFTKTDALNALLKGATGRYERSVRQSEVEQATMESAIELLKDVDQ